MALCNFSVDTYSKRKKQHHLITCSNGKTDGMQICINTTLKREIINPFIINCTSDASINTITIINTITGETISTFTCER